MRISTQLRVALGILIALLIAILAAAFYVPYELNAPANERYAEDAIPLRSLVEDLVVQIANQQTAVQGYLLTRNQVDLKPYVVGVDAANADLRALVPYQQRHPSLEPFIRRSTVEIADVEGLLAREIARLRPAAGGEQAQPAIGEINRAFARFRATAQLMLAETDKFVADAKGDQEATYRRLLVILGSLGSFAIVIGALLVAFTPRRIGQLYEAEEQARREAESRADAARALAHVADGVVLTDRSGNVRFCNPAAERILGIRRASATDRLLEDLVPAFSDLSRRGGTPAGAAVAPIQHAHGERWVAFERVDFVEGVVYAIRDVTEERALERMRSDFVATASHELRTPMTGIYGAARTLLREDLALSGEQHRRLLEMIATESERLSQILDDILLANRLDADRVDLSTVRCDVGAVAQTVLEAAKARAPANVNVRLEAPPDVPSVAADPNRLQQVLLNIVDNAIKYSPEGGDVVVSIEPNGERLRVVVRDEGLGFPATERERIFDRFHRLDPGQVRGIGGTGLGLYISRELVERMDGRIWADSEPGRGSSFFVELPLAS